MRGPAAIRTATDLAILLGAFSLASVVAGAFGAANFGTALVWVLVRR
jgi:hypothetical protein